MFIFFKLTLSRMKKVIMAVGLLLVAAVFMSGCVTEAEDPIVGIWHNDKFVTSPSGSDFDSRVYVFNADGSGFSLFQFDGELVSGKLDFTWKNEGDGKYIMNYANTKGANIQATYELLLDGDVLYVTVESIQFEHHRESAAEYLVGLWATDVYDYKELIVVSLVYISEDGTGNLIIYGSDVMGIDDVRTTKFTWEEKDGVMYCVEEDGVEFTLTLKNGVLYEGKEEVLHKYAVEDRLLGIWMSDEPSKEAEGTFDIVILLRPDGTGVEIWTLPGSHVASAKYYFEWEMTSPTTYQAVYDDGEVWDFANEFTKLTDGEVTYSKVGYDVLAEYAKKVTA